MRVMTYYRQLSTIDNNPFGQSALMRP